MSIGKVGEELDKLNINTRWTITAAAKEYRETLALERTLEENPEKGIELLQQQMTEAPFQTNPSEEEEEEEEEAGTLV